MYGQQSTNFWNGISIRPNIVLDNESDKYIIDTKWKNIAYSQPSTHDLRLMYVYNDYWTSTKAMLLYPSNKSEFNGFIPFENNNSKKDQHECGLGKISIFKENDNSLNDEIGEEIIKWFSYEQLQKH